jgi:hypothetical protein
MALVVVSGTVFGRFERFPDRTAVYAAAARGAA